MFQIIMAQLRPPLLLLPLRLQLRLMLQSEMVL
jgi:hypothetical protein